jgi:hypothetical protein
MRFNVFASSLAAALVLPVISFAAPLYSENFEVDPTANWSVFKGPATVDEAHNFFFDYSTVGIPKAPNSKVSDGTRGMKLQVNLTSGVFGGMSVSPNGQSFSGDYMLKFDWWGNFNGPFPAGGSGSTNLSTYGIGTAGASAQWPGGVQDSLWFGATSDGGSSVDYRAYSPAAGTGYTPASGVFAAGTGTSPDARNDQHPYYAGIGGVSAPPAQTALFPQQTGVTGTGAAGMQWHQVTIAKEGDIVTWHLGNKLIATVDSSTFTFGGGNILFGHSDINSGSSSDANDVHLLFTLIDNVRVVPEPSALALCLIGAIALLGARRRG